MYCLNEFVFQFNDLSFNSKTNINSLKQISKMQFLLDCISYLMIEKTYEAYTPSSTEPPLTLRTVLFITVLGCREKIRAGRRFGSRAIWTSAKLHQLERKSRLLNSPSLPMPHSWHFTHCCIMLYRRVANIYFDV